MIEELTNTIKSLPNNKANGPNGLTYEMRKKFSKDYLHIIFSLFNNILPNRWQKALLYPIPKPEYWNCDPNKTRPIILLDTLRKIFTKIITARPNTFLASTNALQPNNQAGLQGSSTMIEIIFKLQTITTQNTSPLLRTT
ncbi:RNA-directed DNA polymerase from mobile element jockey-like [Rhizophagus clarus]|nr:RNA-directed DNA polymerase from mobile element jockey-like [Rhizophagus clarus]